LLLLHWILLAFRMLIFLEVVLIERELLVPAIFSNPLLFAGLLRNNLQLLNPPQRLSMWLLLPNPMDCAYHERLWSDL
jgi:hypothetical protein